MTPVDPQDLRVGADQYWTALSSRWPLIIVGVVFGFIGSIARNASKPMSWKARLFRNCLDALIGGGAAWLASLTARLFADHLGVEVSIDFILALCGISGTFGYKFFWYMGHRLFGADRRERRHE